eukprot:13508041-Heterocapsa_arctica.AAC.1
MEVESFGPHGAEASSTPQGETTAGIPATRKRPSDTSVQEAEFASGSGSLPDPRSPVPLFVRHYEELAAQRSASAPAPATPHVGDE